MEKFADVDDFLAAATRWHDEAATLRTILLGCKLDEAVKWGKPCYSHEGNNIAIVQPFKDFLALMFFKGALLDDPRGVLEEQGQNTRSARRVRFTSVAQVRKLRPTVRALVRAAIEVEKQGKTVPKPTKLVLVEELRARLDRDPELRAAFEQLTPGRQRAYHLDISGAKQSKTRLARIDKHAPRILAGKGLRDR